MVDPAERLARLVARINCLDESDCALEVRASTVPEAGFGLFARTEIAANSLVCTYSGSPVTFTESLKYPDKRYLMRLGRARSESSGGGKLVFVDGRRLETLEEALHEFEDARELPLGRFINDIRPYNVEFVKKPEEGRADVVALRDIKAGEEISVCYGKFYWAAHELMAKAGENACDDAE